MENIHFSVRDKRVLLRASPGSMIFMAIDFIKSKNVAHFQPELGMDSPVGRSSNSLKFADSETRRVGSTGEWSREKEKQWVIRCLSSRGSHPGEATFLNHTERFGVECASSLPRSPCTGSQRGCGR